VKTVRNVLAVSNSDSYLSLPNDDQSSNGCLIELHDYSMLKDNAKIQCKCH